MNTLQLVITFHRKESTRVVYGGRSFPRPRLQGRSRLFDNYVIFYSIVDHIRSTRRDRKDVVSSFVNL